MNAETAVWMLLSVNFCIAAVFTWSLTDHAVGWRAAVRNWVGGKAVWLGVLTIGWAFGWVGFLPSAPDHAWIVHVVALLIYTVVHIRAYLFWVTGRSVPPVTSTETMTPTEQKNDKVEPLKKANGDA